MKVKVEIISCPEPTFVWVDSVDLPKTIPSEDELENETGCQRDLLAWPVGDNGELVESPCMLHDAWAFANGKLSCSRIQCLAEEPVQEHEIQGPREDPPRPLSLVKDFNGHVYLFLGLVPNLPDRCLVMRQAGCDSWHCPRIKPAELFVELDEES